MDVVEHEDDRSLRSEQSQDGRDAVERGESVLSVRLRDVTASIRERTEHLRPRPERSRTAVLDASTPARLGARRQRGHELAHQPGLADSRLTPDEHGDELPGAACIEASARTSISSVRPTRVPSDWAKPSSPERTDFARAGPWSPARTAIRQRIQEPPVSWIPPLGSRLFRNDLHPSHQGSRCAGSASPTTLQETLNARDHAGTLGRWCR